MVSLPPFTAHTQAYLSKALIMVDPNKVCGSIWANADDKLCSIVNLIAQLNSRAVKYVLMNGINKLLFPLKIGPQLLSWLPVVIA